MNPGGRDAVYRSAPVVLGEGRASARAVRLMCFFDGEHMYRLPGPRSRPDHPRNGLQPWLGLIASYLALRRRLAGAVVKAKHTDRAIRSSVAVGAGTVR